MQQVDPRSGQGLDGTFDERGHKPLPLSPIDGNARPSLQSDVERTFFADVSQPESFNYNPSIVSSGITRIREQDELRSLVSATMSGPQELSPKDKNFWNRYSSSTSQSAPSSPKTFTTFAAKNPYRDSNEPPITSAAHPAPLTYHKNEVSSTVWPFRASDNTMSQEDAIEESCDARAYGSAQRGRSTPQKPHISIEDGQRGRKPLTPPSSPSRSRFNIQRPSSPKTPRPRSRSPVKRLVGMVKSMSTNQIPTDLSLPPTTTPSSTNKRRWKELGHKLKHGFLTPDLEQLEQEELMEQYATDNRFDAVRIITPPSTHERSAFPVSIKSSGQSKLWSELEYMLIETCNSFLKDEFDHNRLQRHSVLRTKRQWQARNRPQVIEFYYDQTTQYELVIANLRTVKLYSDYAQDAIILNSVLHQWKILIRELSVKTLCMPDSIVRRWLHDGRRVLELLGALPITLTNMDKLTSLCMAVIGSAEKERARRRVREEVGNAQGNHRRSVSDGSQTTLLKHEAALLNGADGPPPLPGSSSGSSGTTSDSRKVTPQELQRHLVQHAQQRKAAVAQGQTQGQISQGRTSHEAKQFIFTQGNGNSFGYTRGYKHGHGHSKSLEPGEERARFMYD
ncbi:hypothetical protein LTR64_003229 [Lithohypha guttulata]|uniref:uncharacterized protein n=1 Tax=Lithohypha guttulata TaxID=1690604 RepID=UPI002DE121FC|nr:hypothetical protein LTR51_000549 [Lithohypha guttulata]